MNTFDLIDIAFTAREQRKSSPVRSSAHKSCMTSQGQKDNPHADTGSVGVSDPNYDAGPLCSCGARVACRCGPIVDSE